MCIKFSLPQEKQQIEKEYKSIITFSYLSQEVVPYHECPILSNEGIIKMTWGNKQDKIIHKQIKDVENTLYKRGVLPMKEFFTWKKEKLIAPIGFGDHKEVVKIQQFKVQPVKNVIIHVPVLYTQIEQKYTFYILIGRASPSIEIYQPNEPLQVNDPFTWLGCEVTKIDYFSASGVNILQVNN